MKVVVSHVGMTGRFPDNNLSVGELGGGCRKKVGQGQFEGSKMILYTCSVDAQPLVDIQVLSGCQASYSKRKCNFSQTKLNPGAVLPHCHPIQLKSVPLPPPSSFVQMAPWPLAPLHSKDVPLSSIFRPSI